jgi:hypothetical protein
MTGWLFVFLGRNERRLGWGVADVGRFHLFPKRRINVIDWQGFA